MDEHQGVRYWCHSCEEVIDPAPEMKCPGCDGGFVEEMNSEGFEPAANARSDRSLSLLAPLLLGMLGSSRRSRLRREVVDEDDDDDEDDEDSDRELEEFIRRRRRRGSSALARLLQTLHDDARGSDDNDSDTDRDRERERARERQRERERERQRDRGRERTESLILINSNNEAIILQGTFGPDDNNQEESGNTASGVSLGDYFLGPGLDVLLQRLVESDLNRSGTPPAKKEAVVALPTVSIQEVLGCSVCLEDFEMGAEAKEMPCRHKFHTYCLLPWLEMHSSCPICRFQLPTEETKNPCESASSDEVVNSDGDNAAATASSSDHESTSRNGDNPHVTSRNGDNHSGRRIFSALSALFSDSSSSSSDENAPRSSER